MVHAALLCASLLVAQVGDPPAIVPRYQDL